MYTTYVLYPSKHGKIDAYNSTTADGRITVRFAEGGVECIVVMSLEQSYALWERISQLLEGRGWNMNRSR